MAKCDAKATVPKVRFPEFVGAQNWSVAPMRKLYAFMRNNLLSRDKLNYERGVAKNIHYGDIHTKFQALFDITKERVPFINESEPVPGADSEDYCVEGDLIFADASEDMNDVGRCIEVVQLAGEKLLSGQHTILARRKDDALVIGFGGHLFRSGLIRSRIEKEAQGTKVYQISSSRLGSIDITYPSDKGEQQKIADCLTSLDEVIAAQGRKVEVLKAHKRGLMQQLFPREGETRPRLRFPEFRDAPEWEKKQLAELGEIITGKTPSTSNAGLWGGGILFITPTDIDDGGKYQDTSQRTVVATSALKVLPVGSIAYTCIASIGKLAITVRPSVTNQQINSVITRPSIDNEFVYYALVHLTPWIKSIPATSTLPIINKTEFSAIEIGIPSDSLEQKAVADCLASLDTQITAESHQLAALKAHKQGLMQQLFPAPEAATA